MNIWFGLLLIIVSGLVCAILDVEFNFKVPQFYWTVGVLTGFFASILITWLYLQQSAP